MYAGSKCTHTSIAGLRMNSGRNHPYVYNVEQTWSMHVPAIASTAILTESAIPEADWELQEGRLYESNDVVNVNSKCRFEEGRLHELNYAWIQILLHFALIFLYIQYCYCIPSWHRHIYDCFTATFALTDFLVCSGQLWEWENLIYHRFYLENKTQDERVHHKYRCTMITGNGLTRILSIS